MQATEKQRVLCSGCWFLCLADLLLTSTDLTTYVIRFLFGPALCFGRIALLMKRLFLRGFGFWLALESHLSAPFLLPRRLPSFSYSYDVPYSCYHITSHDCSLIIIWGFSKEQVETIFYVTK